MNQTGTRKNKHMYLIAKVELNKYQAKKEKTGHLWAQAVNSALLSSEGRFTPSERIIIWHLFNNFDISDKAALKKVRSYQEENTYQSRLYALLVYGWQCNEWACMKS